MCQADIQPGSKLWSMDVCALVCLREKQSERYKLSQVIVIMGLWCLSRKLFVFPPIPARCALYV